MADAGANGGRDVAIGVDLGGTNLRAALFRGLGAAAVRRAADIAAALPGEEPAPVPPRPVVEHREPVGSDRTPAVVAARLTAVVAKLVREAGDDGPIPVGIGFAGMLRGHDGMVAVSPHLRWRNVEFGAMMRARLGEAYPVAIYNDVNAVTYGEYALGAGATAPDVLAVFVGTGIGGGIVASGRLLEGAQNCAAEIGHTKVVYGEGARPCACGLSGCVEAYAGGADLQARARAELAAGARSRASELAGSPERVNPGHLDAAAAGGDAYALSLFGEIAPLLGVALANAVTLLNPGRLILGGGVLSRTPFLRTQVIAAFEAVVNPPALESLVISDAALGDDAGLVGSALLAAREPAAVSARGS